MYTEREVAALLSSVHDGNLQHGGLKFEVQARASGRPPVPCGCSALKIPLCVRLLNPSPGMRQARRRGGLLRAPGGLLPAPGDQEAAAWQRVRCGRAHGLPAGTRFSTACHALPAPCEADCIGVLGRPEGVRRRKAADGHALACAAPAGTASLVHTSCPMEAVKGMRVNRGTVTLKIQQPGVCRIFLPPHASTSPLAAPRAGHLLPAC